MKTQTLAPVSRKLAGLGRVPAPPEYLGAESPEEPRDAHGRRHTIMETRMLLPMIEEDSAFFWEGTKIGELRVQACPGCGRLRFPPRPMCPGCQSLESAWKVMSGRGSIWSYVVPHPPLLPAYAEVAPYNVIVVALEEGETLRMVGNLVASPEGAINEIDPGTIEIGAPVEAVYAKVSDDVTMVRWTPRGGLNGTSDRR